MVKPSWVRISKAETRVATKSFAVSNNKSDLMKNHCFPPFTAKDHDSAITGKCPVQMELVQVANNVASLLRH